MRRCRAEIRERLQTQTAFPKERRLRNEPNSVVSYFLEPELYAEAALETCGEQVAIAIPGVHRAIWLRCIGTLSHKALPVIRLGEINWICGRRYVHRRGCSPVPVV